MYKGKASETQKDVVYVEAKETSFRRNQLADFGSAEMSEYYFLLFKQARLCYLLRQPGIVNINVQCWCSVVPPLTGD